MKRRRRLESRESPPTGGLSAVIQPPPRLIERVGEIVERVHIPLLASALTFDTLLAMVPLAVLAAETLRWVLEHTSTIDPGNPSVLLTTLLPRHHHVDGPEDPFRMIEGLMTSLQNYSSSLSWVAVPVFLWFGTRVFGAMRACLVQVFDVKLPPRHRLPVYDFVLGYLHGKLRDLGLIALVLSLAGVNALLSVALVVFNADTVSLTPPMSFFASTLGRVFAEVVTVGSAFLLFAMLYRFGSPQRLAWRGTAIAALTATVGFELAKRLYGLYLARSTQVAVYSVDAGMGAALLFLLWVWWVALVFLIGAAAGKVWESGRRQ
ncbi:MAG TPA: YihY/virulence factor BrkB family protein [Gemmatimonadales bacterium]|nr:YihY/virulence factor BrkB family protein [Gemmatimonadales bacterium]